MPFTSENAHTGTQFQPGQSGNPAGKPKGTKHLSTWIQDLMEDESFNASIFDINKGYVEFKGAPAKAIVTVAVHKAVAGDEKAREWLGKYGYGTKLELANNPENPITSPVTRDELDTFLSTIKDATKQK